jgi:superfamily II DNA helicase RecQ
MEQYREKIQSISEPTFKKIQAVAANFVAHLPKTQLDRLWNNLERGTALLESHEEMCVYLRAFGNMHEAKLVDAISKLPAALINNPFEIVDWGCGQGIGTMCLLDRLNNQGLINNVKNIILIEPGRAALERAELHVTAYLDDHTKINTICDFFENIDVEKISSERGYPVIHIFSNILDVSAIDLKKLSQLVDDAVHSDNYLLCVGPRNPTNHRLDAFFNYFDTTLIKRVYEFESYNFGYQQKWTYKAKVYKLEPSDNGHLINIAFYPSVQFQAAYELDIIRESRKKDKTGFTNKWVYFEVAAPFDLGASVYDDVHPILAVLNNLIVRGLPTRANIYIEEVFSNSFTLTKKRVNYGEISYSGIHDLDLSKFTDLVNTSFDNDLAFSENDKQLAQFIFTPISIARFQKVLIEAVITGQLNLGKEKWILLVEENDVPFANIALQDFKNQWYHLTALSDEYYNYRLPDIELHVISNKLFIDSPIQQSQNVYLDIPSHISNLRYDLVVTQASFKTDKTPIDSFSKFKCYNNCYFNIKSISKPKGNRVVYTSSLIKYKALVEKTNEGIYIENTQVVPHLEYFLQQVFRKNNFRPGQLPIMDRAMRKLPVIGLLPTGGGKSLTYQLTAMLQPGVTMIIDPLKSLMKDQYDGLISNGIDSCAFLNSTQSAPERASVENKLESSELLMIFLSPERLSIASFRERLKKMHDFNVYFSYGVIDEVHCVSEWGHDFRFSYLHLGRNLYNYVRAKDGEISLFGLTATASFDVLADVERELSGTSSFSIDADAIVRYENTNRLELQYKIERVQAKFDIDNFYDQGKLMAAELPKALNINNHWPQFEAKRDYLAQYIQDVPKYVRKLQETASIEKIRNSYMERQNAEILPDTNLSVDMPELYFATNESYQQAGIIFCPHVKKTPLSVEVNKGFLNDQTKASIGSFSGADDDHKSMQNLEDFRDNKLPIMVATKAFGMGIDKPNVRFTVNMNYSSSLEAFVQEAGRAGRDRKIALSTILVSDYKLSKITSNVPFTHKIIPIIRNKWFHHTDLIKILDHYDIKISDEYILTATPNSDIVRLHCSKDNQMFSFGNCNTACSVFPSCRLKNVTNDTKGWKTEKELIAELDSQNIKIAKKHFQYLNADYQAVMFFFYQSFKGEMVEKTYMFRLLNEIPVEYVLGVDNISHPGFLTPLINTPSDKEITIYVPYIPDKDVPDDLTDDTKVNRESDLAKTIYRMCSIEMVKDFTQDYANRKFRIIAVRKSDGEYYAGLEKFLLRYYTPDRAQLEIGKAKEKEVSSNIDNSITIEIYRCLSYLTDFIYDKISEKRKRAIDDMRDFCMEGLSEEHSWIDNNEALKDFIFYYFNSKYAKATYIAPNEEDYSLVNDTEGGKKSDVSILEKYLKVIDDNIVGPGGTPLDNVRHLYGAVRIISRSLTDNNPTLALLEAFCLSYLPNANNENLKNLFIQRYSDGMINMSRRTTPEIFWEMFERYNKIVSVYIDSDSFDVLVTETTFLLHSDKLTEITNKYLSTNE